MDYKKLCSMAIKAPENSYSPYSNFKVGAAILCKDGSIYTGCNVENASYSATVCAERTAIFKAISEGKKDFSAIAIAGGKNGKIEKICPPCGVCRQVISEFCDKDFKIVLVKDSESFEEYTLSALLPLSFGNESMKE